MTPNQALNEFFSLFDTNTDGKITQREFINYYTDIGTVIQGEDSFRDLINKTWGLKNGEMSMDEAQVKHYVGLVREKLITSTEGVQDEFKLRNIFASFGAQNDLLSRDDFDALLLKLNIEVPLNLLPRLFKALDKNRSGYIEFFELENFVLYNPYK